jgi:hypothetical protein
LWHASGLFPTFSGWRMRPALDEAAGERRDDRATADRFFPAHRFGTL